MVLLVYFFVGFLVNLFVCFLIICNISKIMDCFVLVSVIIFFNGVCVFSMWWVILGYIYFWFLVYWIISKLVLYLYMGGFVKGEIYEG